MNCKQGDMAVIVDEADGCEENLGAFVEVLDREDAVDDEWRCVCLHKRLLTYEDYVGNNIDYIAIGEEVWIPDACLRPIRDNDQKDETLEWAGKPRLIVEPA